MSLSEATICGSVQAWVNTNKEDVVRSYCRKKGWESWAQTELANHLQSLPGRPRIKREQQVYGNGKQAMNVSITCDDASVFTVELKCESLFASVDPARFRRGHLSYPLFEADIHKLRRRRSAAGNAMAMMIAVSAEAQASIQSLIAAYSIEKKTFNATDDWMVAVYKY